MYFFAWQSQGNYGNLAFFNAVMTTHTFTNRKSFLVHPYISVHRFKKLVQLLPVKIRKFSCLIFGAYVFALIDCSHLE